MAEKAFFLNDPKITANELLDSEYHFVICTWQFVMSRYAAYQKNVDFFFDDFRITKTVLTHYQFSLMRRAYLPTN